MLHFLALRPPCISCFWECNVSHFVGLSKKLPFPLEISIYFEHTPQMKGKIQYNLVAIFNVECIVSIFIMVLLRLLVLFTLKYIFL